jgi:glycosyltransferase involved in cell wall biosynthesis
MKVILIGNYPPDSQESMSRFAEMLKTGLQERGIQCGIWFPKVVFGKFVKSPFSGVGKWFGYIDKWFLFPVLIRLRLLTTSATSDVKFHVCDHSNSPYLRHLPKDKVSITCHDVLAIRGALGYEDAFCPASRLGEILQKWILNNLIKANKIAFDTRSTFDQFMELAGDIPPKEKWVIIHCAFNAEFRRLDKKHARAMFGIPAVPYVLSVGSNLQRKNRRLLIDMISGLGDKWNGTICYAGDPADDELLRYAEKLGVKDRIVSVTKPDHETLLALYGECEALIFPSFSEGFGWPLIEAQACGAPVIASNIEPMPEVSNGSALHADPYQPETFVSAFLRLSDQKTREKVINKGFQNAKRFDLSKMVESYLALIG